MPDFDCSYTQQQVSRCGATHNFFIQDLVTVKIIKRSYVHILGQHLIVAVRAASGSCPCVISSFQLFSPMYSITYIYIFFFCKIGLAKPTVICNLQALIFPVFTLFHRCSLVTFLVSTEYVKEGFRSISKVNGKSHGTIITLTAHCVTVMDRV